MKLTEYLNRFEIFCDMDSVLTDFHKQVRKIHPQFDNGIFDETERWRLINAEGPKFWSEMEWMKDGKRLWDYIKKYNVTILSTYGKSRKNAIVGKRIWIKRELGSKYSINAIIIKSRKKSKYADENKILIDDMMKNIIGWEIEGGIGIHHINTNDTIKQLEDLGV